MTSNDEAQKNLILEIKGEILVDVMVEPRSLSFRQLAKGQEATVVFTVKAGEPERIKIGALKLDDPRFELKMVSGDLAAESKWELKFKGAAEIGSIQAKIVVEYAAEGPQTYEIPIHASVVGDLQYVRSLHFGKSKTGEFRERELRLSSRSGKNVKILKVEDPDGLLKIDLATAEGNPAVIKAQVADPGKDYSKPDQHTLKVTTNSADEPVVEVGYIISDRVRGPAEMTKGGMGPLLDGRLRDRAAAAGSPAAATPEQKPE